MYLKKSVKFSKILFFNYLCLQMKFTFAVKTWREMSLLHFFFFWKTPNNLGNHLKYNATKNRIL